MKFEAYARDWFRKQDLIKSTKKTIQQALDAYILPVIGGKEIITIASMIGFVRALDMLKYPEKYDCFESRASRSVKDYFDVLYKRMQEILTYE